MKLEVVVEANVLLIEVPEHIITGARDFFATMDRDMDGGWQMSREWVDAPTPLQLRYAPTAVFFANIDDV